MANRNKGRGGRSRKRRRSAGKLGAVAASAAEREVSGAPAGEPGRRAAARAAGGRARSRAASRSSASIAGGFKAPQSLGERPEAPWHPVPVSELLILIGALATAIGASKLSNDASAGAPTLIAGVAAVLIGTVEFSLREHRSGYRSHTILLALLPTVALYTGSLLLLAAIVSPVPVALKIAPLAFALPVFAVLYKLLRARFQDARRERVFAGGRS